MCISYNTGSFNVSWNWEKGKKLQENTEFTGELFLKNPGNFSLPDMVR